MNLHVSNFPLNIGDHVIGVSGRKYLLERSLGQGGRGTTYIASETGSPETKVVVKLPKIDLTKPIEEIEDRLRDIKADIDHELNAWFRLSNSSMAKLLIADVLDTGHCIATVHDSLKEIPFIVQEFIDGKELGDWCVQKWGEIQADKTQKIFKGIQDKKAWFKVVKKLTIALKSIHDYRVIHGDIWPPNIMVRMMDSATDDYDIVLIDFGQAWFLDHTFQQNGGDARRYPYYAPERWAREGRTWYAPAELYSLGGVFFFLATGESPPSPYHDDIDPLEFKGKGDDNVRKHIKTNTELKDELVRSIRDTNPKLYTENPGVVDIIHYCLRPWPDERAPHAEAIQHLIEIFSDSFGEQGSRSDLGISLDEIQQRIAIIASQITAIERSGNPFFNKMVARRINSLHENVSSARTKIFNITGNRDQIVNDLLACLSCLSKGDECIAVTTSIFWRSQNFGANGRFLTMLKMAALHGITIKWITLITETEEFDDEIYYIMKAHGDTILELQSPLFVKGYPQFEVETHDKSSDSLCFYLGYVVVTEEERALIVRQAKTFITFNRSVNGKTVSTLAAPSYSHRGGNITIIRCWYDPPRYEKEHAKTFSTFLDKSKHATLFRPKPKP